MGSWKNKIKKAIVLISICGMFFSYLPNTYAGSGSAYLMYSNTTDLAPRSRVYTTSSNTYAAATSAPVATAANSWVVSKESPTEDGAVMAVQSSTGKLDIYCRAGTTWTRDIAGITVGTTGATRRFDVDYEQTSGIPMVLYSNNVATTNELSYYRKTGTGCGAGAWTGPTTLNPTRVTGIVLWVELEARKTSGSNVLAAAFSDTSGSAGGTLESMIWNGSWGNESPAPSAAGWSDSSIELNGSAGANTAKAFDLAFETTSGNLIVVWGTNTASSGSNGWRYATCSGVLPCTWTSVQTPNGLYDDATNVACAPDPGSNNVACIGNGNAGNHISAWTWTGSGSGSTANNADMSSLAVTPGNMSVDIDWAVSGSQRVAVGAYTESATGIKYIYYNAGMSGWRYDGTNTVIPGSPATTIKSIQVISNPVDRTKLLVNFTDANSDLWSKRLNYDGTNGGYDTALPAANWSNADAGSALELNVKSITSMPFWLDWSRYVAPSQTIVFAPTAGSKITNLNSGDTAKYINDPTCTTESGCAAFKFTATGGSVTVTSIKISETGTVAAYTTLANPTLVYDTDANFANGTTGTFGTQAAFASDDTVTFTNAGVTIPSGSSYYFYLKFDLASGANYPVGGNTISFQITNKTDVATNATTNNSTVPAVLAGTTTVKPTITSYTNSTETGLNYSAACTNCGARIGPGSGFRQTITINGYGFGADPGLGSRSSATNKVEIVGGATTALKDDASANTNVSAWTNTAITVRTDSNITTNTDTDWGANYGGAAALKVTAGGQVNATNLNFFVFPQVTSLTTPLVASAAREYNAADSDGIVTLNGTRFGSGSTGGWVRIFGCDSSTCSSPSGTVNINSWNSTAIAVQVPTSIANNVYTGSVIMQQGTGTTNKSHTYTTNGFRVLPRLTSLSPVSGMIGSAITLNGDHLCQNAGTCPSAFDANNYIKFTSAISATTFTSWSNTAIVTAAPTGAATGNVYAVSNTYLTNNQNFTITVPTPSDPSGLGQFSDAALSSSLSTGSVSSSTNLYLTMNMQTGVSGGTLYPQIEYDPIGTVFSCTGTSACAQAVEGTGQAGPGPINCSLVSGACAIAIAPTDNVYHWQARVRHNIGGSDYYSNWVSYGANSESATDFQIDKTAPVITFPSGGICSDAVSLIDTNSATVSWILNESDPGQVEYSKNSDLSGSISSALDASSYNHSYPLKNLDSNTTYYFRVKAADAAGNASVKPTSMPFCSFTTTSVTQPAKTNKYYITSIPAQIAGGATATSSFSVYVPENSVVVKSAFLEMNASSPTSNWNSINVDINGSGSTTYLIPANTNYFQIIRKINPAYLNFDPTANTISINPSANLNISSANLVLTYSFAP